MFYAREYHNTSRAELSRRRNRRNRLEASRTDLALIAPCRSSALPRQAAPGYAPTTARFRREFLDQRKELSLLKPDVCVKQSPRRIQRLSIDAASRHGNVECASEPLELHVLDACLAEESGSSEQSESRGQWF